MSEAHDKYQVLIDDNYHHMDESHRTSGGSYADLESAIRACKEIVDRSLEECHEPGMTAAELFGKYKMFGEDPFVAGAESGSVPFSAWTYAEERSVAVCSKRKAAQGGDRKGG